MAPISSPSFRQSVVCSVALSLLSLIVIPFTGFITLIGVLYSFSQPLPHTEKKKTILLTGARNVKCLVLARVFHFAGHRVVVAEEPHWYALNPTRFSRTVSGYYPLPDPHVSTRLYKRALRRLILDEGVDVFIPCSSPSYTIEDGEAALAAREQDGWKGEAFIQHPTHIGQLHWKYDFMNLCKELSMPIPESHLIATVEDAMAILNPSDPAARDHKIDFITKSLVFDDLARTDMTPLPLSTPEETASHLENLPIPITSDSKYLLQQLLIGREYCTHAAVRNGELVAFVCCPSSDMLMRYADVQSVYLNRDAAARQRESEIGERAEQWTRLFLQRWKDKLEKDGWAGGQLTGHFCIDFILDETSGELLPIECNPRAHTAIVLFKDTPNLASYYLGTTSGCARPPRDVRSQSWIGHAFPLSLASLLPSQIRSALHPYLVESPATHGKETYLDPSDSPQKDRDSPLAVLSDFLFLGMEQDPTFDIRDPLPFFVLIHLQWPWLLMKRLFSGKAWSRVNISTSRIWGAHVVKE